MANGALRVADTTELSAEPAFIAYGSDSVWVSAVDGSIWRVDAESSRVISKLNSGAEPAWLAFGHESLWFGRMSDGIVVRLDPATETPLAEIEVEPGDRPMAITFDETSTWVASQTANTVWRLDDASNQILHTFRLTHGRPVDAGPSGLARLGDHLFMSEHRSDSVARIDVTSGELMRRCLGTPNPGRIAVTDDAVWIAESGGLVTQVDPTTLAVTRRLELTGATVGELTATAGTVWFGSGSHAVAYDPESGTYSAVELPPLSPTSGFPGGLAMAAAGNTAWTTDPSGPAIVRLERDAP